MLLLIVTDSIECDYSTSIKPPTPRPARLSSIMQFNLGELHGGESRTSIYMLLTRVRYVEHLSLICKIGPAIQIFMKRPKVR